jgi:Lysylphosphatidylglycerol synthase TM region
VQDTVLLPPLLPKIPKIAVVWFKAALFVGLLAYVVHRVRQQPFDWALVQTQLATVPNAGLWLAGLVLLTPLNWGFEAQKWQLLINPVEKVSFADAYRAVLAGTSLGFVLPAVVGDAAGRVLMLRSGSRAEGVAASLVSGGLQFYVAIGFGAVAWAWQIGTVATRDTVWGRVLLALLVAMTLTGAVLLVFRPKIGIINLPVVGRFVVPPLATLPVPLAFAVLRYLTFSLQFYFALNLYGLTLPLPGASAGIGLVFLAKTITPAFNLLSDLGVREAAALWVFAPYNLPATVLVLATLTLWAANVLLPVLVGLVWVWRLNFSKT